MSKKSLKDIGIALVLDLNSSKEYDEPGYPHVPHLEVIDIKTIITLSPTLYLLQTQEFDAHKLLYDGAGDFIDFAQSDVLFPSLKLFNLLKSLSLFFIMFMTSRCSLMHPVPPNRINSFNTSYIGL